MVNTIHYWQRNSRRKVHLVTQVRMGPLQHGLVSVETTGQEFVRHEDLEERRKVHGECDGGRGDFE